ncbi:MAG: pilus assembly protein N-terminal domain-containing protein [Planctomycetaceae bacterium]
MPIKIRLFAVTIAALLLAFQPAIAFPQTPTGTPGVYHIQPGMNELALFERFSTLVEHSANIRRVQDFDPEVLKIDVVDKNPNQVRVFAIATGVTTITVIDEFGQSYALEVLVRGDVRHLESFVRRLYPNDSIKIEEINGSVRLDGWVTRPEHVSEIQSIAEQFFPNVMNHMKVAGAQQVALKCTIMEVQRSKFRQLGMNFAMMRPNNYLLSTPGPITPIQNLAIGGSGATATLSGFAESTITYGFTKPNSVFQGFIVAMRNEGLLKLHATPTVIAHNGRPANLLNGGETPVITPSGLGTTAIEFKEFGVQLQAVPYILGEGRVRLEVEAAIRDRDFSNSVTVSGVTVPAFIVRKANTQVEMNFGEALMIAGLVSQREDGAAQKIPFLGELPWIGAAFSKKNYTEAETELVIMVTPDIVSPIPADQVPSQGPGMFTDTPVDHELFWHHLLEVPKYGDECENGNTTCMPGSRCQQCQPGGSSPGCLSGDNCVQTTSPLIQPQTASATTKTTLPASSLPASGSNRGVKTTTAAGSGAKAGSGLITPSLR